MKKVIVLGHGGYAEGVRQNLDMVAGLSDHMYFIDLKKDDDLSTLENKVKQLIESFAEDDEVLFACDLVGASPFRVAAMTCVDHPGKYITVAGLNQMAFMELNLSADSDLTIDGLADLAIETTKAAIARFPE